MRFIALLKVVLLSLGVLSVVSCYDDKEPELMWEFYPIVIYAYVEDVHGNDLLAPDVRNNIADSGIKVVYKGCVYDKDSAVDEKVRTYMPELRGLRIEKLLNGRYVLSFGGLEGNKDYEDEMVVMRWNDGSMDTITFDSKIIWDTNIPIVERVFYLNGNEADEIVKIIRGKNRR